MSLLEPISFKPTKRFPVQGILKLTQCWRTSVRPKRTQNWVCECRCIQSCISLNSELWWLLGSMFPFATVASQPLVSAISCRWNCFATSIAVLLTSELFQVDFFYNPLVKVSVSHQWLIPRTRRENRMAQGKSQPLHTKGLSLDDVSAVVVVCSLLRQRVLCWSVLLHKAHCSILLLPKT